MNSSEGHRDDIKVFISYAQADEGLFLALGKHLSAIRQSKLIRDWHCTKIKAGEDFARETSEHLKSSDVILLLISSDYLDSKSNNDIEIEEAIQRHNNQKARVIPVLLRRVDWQNTFFENLKPLPCNGSPVSSWSNQDEALFDVAKGVRDVVEDLIKKRYNDRLSQYETHFLRTINQVYPIPQIGETSLIKIRRNLGIKDQDVEKIERPIREKKESEYRQYQEKIEDYKKCFLRLIESEYPLTETSRGQLFRKRQVLALEEKDTRKIEEPIYILKESEYRQRLKEYEQEFRKLFLLGTHLEDQKKENLLLLRRRLKITNFNAKEIEREVISQTQNVPNVNGSESDLNSVSFSKIPNISLLVSGFLGSLYRPRFSNIRSPLAWFILTFLFAGAIGATSFALSQVNLVINSWRNSAESKKSINSSLGNLSTDSQSFSKEDAIHLIRSWQSVKPRVFGRERNLSLIDEYISGRKHASTLSSIARLDEKGAHYVFTEDAVADYEGHFCRFKHRAEIHLKLTEVYSEYVDESQQKNFSEYTTQAAFGFMYTDGSWKYVDDGQSTSIEGLKRFRQRFWGEDLFFVEQSRCES
ncbi:MAG: toll/interleukin-1 receptor domain-containing protein [Kaiparowitsia implicata GSE-PSE-MK54-09C]|jgi:hypothetical protein|nr:toll/interleukin-1 receptor domain-containing protein [Kaiparowitsia implicata GSE-PSE-MK54-09C]